MDRIDNWTETINRTNREENPMCNDDIIRIKKYILEGVNRFITHHFSESPYNYLYESDIQSHLFSILRENVQYEPPVLIVNESKTISQDSHFKLNLIYTEYSNRIDIGCIDPTNPCTVKTYKEIYKQIRLDKVKDDSKPVNLEKDPLWDQPLLYGIEIKHITPGYENNFPNVKKDLDKMERYKGNRSYYAPNFEYLVLCFVLEPTNRLNQKIMAYGPVDRIEEPDNAYIISKGSIHKYVEK